MEWLSEQNVYTQTLCGTLFTWGVTALGAGMIFILPKSSSMRYGKKLLDCSLGFAAGVMLAASYWSLLAPAIDHSEQQFDEAQRNKKLAWLPVAVGFALGAAFVSYAGGYADDLDIKKILVAENKKSSRQDNIKETIISGRLELDKKIRLRIKTKESNPENQELKTTSAKNEVSYEEDGMVLTATNWKRMMSLIIAITVHNIPEGMAVGVGFGLSKTNPEELKKAFNLALGIGLQNFPEGLAVSLPLACSGVPYWKAFFWGQFSGFVEPIFGMVGVFFVNISEHLLPYALGFAAGAMVFVVLDDIIPDACSRNQSSLTARFAILGFIVMMAMDVALG